MCIRDRSIKQHGVIQPILVAKDGSYYTIIAGERRYRASVLAGLKEVPVIVKEFTQEEIVQIALIENLQREDLNDMEEAMAYRELRDRFHFTQEEICLLYTSLSISKLSEGLKDIVNVTEKRVSVELIIQTVAKHYNLTYSDLLSPKRTSNIAAARQTAMFLCREMTELSLQNIGDSFGGRDYSTVIHACHKVQEKKEQDGKFKKELEQIINDVRNNN